eukprot:TRINITY_DN49096_c0_g1_i1.p1 TRINITY_DN49096_c0_g1~~TRINITY_DN49096_c0_g1_i1.p1  ORF type:complete len:288 (-),score=43.35 TRINITY_DN49096_c0_g1_i1:239-1102(-)
MTGVTFPLDVCIVLADMATGAAFLSVLWRLRTTASTEGLSLQTLLAAVCVRAIHLVSHLLGVHYVPKTLPPGLFMFLDCMTLTVGLASLALFFLNFGSYEIEKDNFGIQVFDSPKCLGKFFAVRRLRWFAATSVLYISAAGLGLVWHHMRSMATNDDDTSKRSYYMSMYEVMAAVCLLPQLWMFHQDKRVPPLLANFVIWLALHKFLVLTFWVTYPHLVGSAPSNRNLQIGFDSMSLLILADFLYYWAWSKLHGLDEVIIGGEIELYPKSSTDDAEDSFRHQAFADA